MWLKCYVWCKWRVAFCIRTRTAWCLWVRVGKSSSGFEWWQDEIPLEYFSWFFGSNKRVITDGETMSSCKKAWWQGGKMLECAVHVFNAKRRSGKSHIAVMTVKSCWNALFMYSMQNEHLGKAIWPWWTSNQRHWSEVKSPKWIIDCCIKQSRNLRRTKLHFCSLIGEKKVREF